MDADSIGALFHIPPAEFTRELPSELLATALGATLYLPAVRPRLADDIMRCYADGVMSMICCLEDAIRDDQVDEAQIHLTRQIHQLAETGFYEMSNDGPLIFIRVRRAEQIYQIADQLGSALSVISGFVIPKFDDCDESRASIQAVRDVRETTMKPLYFMPIVESPGVAYTESRITSLMAVRDLLDQNRDLALAVRVGMTDISGVFGLRRPVGFTVWDLGLISTILSDIINVFVRVDGKGFTTIGPVWEYFHGGRRTSDQWERLAEQDTPSGFAHGIGDRDQSPFLNGLIREVSLDLANGLHGKTIIHPSHAPVVHAMSVVQHEDYCDASAICMETDGTGGVLRSAYSNKMNEVRPHRAWAGRILRRAAIFGVAVDGVSSLDLLESYSTRKVLV